jgi:hypothetical protein
MDPTESFTNASKLCLILCLVLNLVACNVKDQSELYGRYLADYEVAKEKLTLNRDATFTQEVVLKASSKVEVATGTWSYNPETGYVSLNGGFIVVLNGLKEVNPDNARRKPGLVVLPADSYFGGIVIGAAKGVLYKKVKDIPK